MLFVKYKKKDQHVLLHRKLALVSGVTVRSSSKCFPVLHESHMTSGTVTPAKGLCLRRLFVCFKDYAKTTKLISMKVYGGLGHDPRTNPNNFGEDPANGFFTFFKMGRLGVSLDERSCNYIMMKVN